MFLNFEEGQHCLSTFRNDMLRIPKAVSTDYDRNRGLYEIYYTPVNETSKFHICIIVLVDIHGVSWFVTDM